MNELGGYQDEDKYWIIENKIFIERLKHKSMRHVFNNSIRYILFEIIALAEEYCKELEKEYKETYGESAVGDDFRCGKEALPNTISERDRTCFAVEEPAKVEQQDMGTA